MIDLHVHTTASDGQYTPSEIIKMAKNKGISLLAITDHDTVTGIAEGAEAAKKAGIGFIPGIEISSKSSFELHILGYYINPENPALMDMCELFAEDRRQRGDRIIDYLRLYGINLDISQAQKHVKGKVLSRSHFAKALIEGGYVKTFREAFDKYLATPEFQSVERPKPTPLEGIKAISEAGGIAVLAHPAQTRLTYEGLDTLVRELAGYGLGGIECLYSEHNAPQTAFFLSLAKKYDLAVAGGSDYHGEMVKPDIALGTGINDSLHIRPEDISEIFHI